MEAVTSSTGTYLFSQSFILASANEIFFPRNIIELLRVFLCWLKLLLKLDGGQFLKTNHIPASGHHFFEFFRDSFFRGLLGDQQKN